MDRADQSVTLDEKRQRAKSRRRTTLFVLLIVLIALICVWWWLKTPATGWVNNSGAVQEQSSDTSGITIFKGLYISFNYPALLSVKRHESDSTAGTENIFLHRASDIPAENYSIAVTVLPATTTIDEVSAVRLRRNDPATYTEATFPSHSGLLFTKKSDGYEKTLLWQEKGHTYSVSMSVPLASTAADNIFIQIMKDSQTVR